MSVRSWPTCVTGALAAMIVSAAGPGRADEPPGAPIADSELDQMRGGYLAADGMQFNFGALLTTTVNGQLALQTQVNFTPQGPQITQTTGPSTVQGVSAANGAITGLKLQGFDPSQVAVLNNGATALIQKVTGGNVQNIVINTASNQNIRQSTELQLDMPALAQMGQTFQQNLAMTHLMQNVQSALAAGH